MSRIEESKKMLEAFGATGMSMSFTDSMFIPISDTECLQTIETTLKNGAVLQEIMHWKVSDDGTKMLTWGNHGDPMSHKLAVDGKPVTHEYFYPSHKVPPAGCADGEMTAKDAAKLCHLAFAKGDVDAITSIWADTIIHAVCPKTEDIPHSGVHVGKDAGLAWLQNYAMSGIAYEWVEETCIVVNENMCFTFAIATYKDGSKGCECMRWITKDGKLISWTCFGNTIVHAKK